MLDIGDIAKTFYLGATELGLDAFVASAINEVNIEARLASKPMGK
ncbi:hypothetical protein [Xanthomonas sacchari]|nr:hypothetical protein [Xanthomonas sacchari]